MANSTIFVKAHQAAKQGNAATPYRVRFSQALKAAFAAVKATATAPRCITEISVWKSSDKKDVRVYVSFSDNSQGCYYKTGNNYHEKGSLENLTLEEKREALRISSTIYGQGIWGRVYQNQIDDRNSIFLSERRELNRDLRKGLKCNTADYFNM